MPEFSLTSKFLIAQLLAAIPAIHNLNPVPHAHETSECSYKGATRWRQTLLMASKLDDLIHCNEPCLRASKSRSFEPYRIPRILTVAGTRRGYLHQF
jgi:hypothetical protein